MDIIMKEFYISIIINYLRCQDIIDIQGIYYLSIDLEKMP